MSRRLTCLIFFFFNDTATTEIYTLSLHDALPISDCPGGRQPRCEARTDTQKPAADARGEGVSAAGFCVSRSEEHTSELQSPCNLVCRLLLEKKKTSVRRSTIGSRSTCIIGRTSSP